MSLNTQSRAADQGGGRVYDTADPDRHGKIIREGEQQSEVRFDDGAERVIPKAHLRQVGATFANAILDALPGAKTDELTQVNSSNPTSEDTVIHRGKEAWYRLRTHTTFEDWKAVGKACSIGQATAMRDAHANKPKGRGYNAAIAAWDKKHGFADLDKGVRSRLLDVMSHLAGIEAELAKLPDVKRQELNHPNAVWRFWKRVTKPPSSSVSPVQKLKDSIASLQEDNDRMRREIDRGGGDLWTPEDRPKDIAKIILGKLTKAKAEKVAREILTALKNGENK
jgi:hypothetical protein